LCASLVATAAQAATASGSGKATIVRPLTLVKTADLNFGAIIPAPTAGTVTIDSATGAISSAGAVTRAGGSPSRATFITITDGIGFIQVRIATTALTLTRPGGGSMTATLVLNNLPGLQFGSTPTQKTAFVGDNAVVTIGVGGTLNVGANQPKGVYTATFNVTADYL
jgi:hypothetical protein